jgi:hypothetical protein
MSFWTLATNEAKVNVPSLMVKLPTLENTVFVGTHGSTSLRKIQQIR